MCLPLSAVLHSRNRLRRMVLVSINRVNEFINRADQRVTGGHASPPLRLGGYKFTAQAVEFVQNDTFSTVPRHNHPVRLRRPPLHRRGMYRPYSSWILFQ